MFTAAKAVDGGTAVGVVVVVVVVVVQNGGWWYKKCGTNSLNKDNLGYWRATGSSANVLTSGMYVKLI